MSGSSWQLLVLFYVGYPFIALVVLMVFALIFRHFLRQKKMREIRRAGAEVDFTEGGHPVARAVEVPEAGSDAVAEGMPLLDNSARGYPVATGVPLYLAAGQPVPPRVQALSESTESV